MNIIFLIGQLKYSGAENVLRCIAPAIAQKGHNVEIMVRAEGFEKEILPNVTIKYCGAKGNAIQRRLRRCKKIKDEINRFHADVIVGFGFPMNFDAVTAARGTRARSIICERMDPYTCSSNLKFEVQKSLYYKFADGYVVQTPKILEFYRQHYANKKEIAVIPNPVRNRTSEISSENEMGDYIITVGRLDDEQKNQTMLIRAFSQITDKYPNLKLLIAGEGPDRGKYEKEIQSNKLEDKVILLGNISDPTKLVDHSLIFLLTSNHEGMPNALIEAMSLGKPCISTKCSGGGAEYLIQNGKNGILIDCNDVDECAKAIELLINDSQKRKTLGENALHINKRLNLSAITDRWIEYFSRVCQ